MAQAIPRLVKIAPKLLSASIAMDLAKLQSAQKAVVGHQLVAMDQYFIHNNPEGSISINDFPIVPVGDIHDKTQSFTHAFDIIRDVGSISMEDMLQIILEGKQLPPPFSFKNPIGNVDIQYILTNEGDGTRNLVKHLFVGVNKPRMLTSKLIDAAMGEVFCLDISKFQARRLVPLTMQYLLQQTSGIGIFKKIIQTTEVKKEIQSQAQVDEAFDYIEENAPLGSGHNESFRWVVKEKNNPQSPVFHWQQGQIEKAIQNIANAKALSKVNTVYPLSLKDFKNWVLLEVMVPCLQHSLQHSILFAGVSGIGLADHKYNHT